MLNFGGVNALKMFNFLSNSIQIAGEEDLVSQTSYKVGPYQL